MAELENGLLHFFKYQGTGNDFICIDNRKSVWKKEDVQKLVPGLCDRRFGIGADGVQLIQNVQGFDFQMIIFNPDGGEADMCGNGSRCLVAFAKLLGVVKDSAIFLAKDGEHEGRIEADNRVRIKMQDVDKVEVNADGSCILDTGEPHYVVFVCDLNKVDVVSEGRKIRYSERFKEEGINVNFLSTEDLEEDQQETPNNVTQSIASHGRIKVFTYERGNEEQTFACGTGATASAIAYFFCKKKKNGTLSVDEKEVSVDVAMKGGGICVSFDYVGGMFTNVFQCGPAEFVFEGKIKV